MSMSHKSQSDSKVFQLKGSMLSVVFMELLQSDFSDLTQQLQEKATQAPDFFKSTPLVFSLDKLPEQAVIDFKFLIDACRNEGLFPFAVKGGTAQHGAAAQQAGLTVIPSAKNERDRAEKKVKQEKFIDEKSTAPQSSVKAVVADAEHKTPAGYHPTRVVTEPVRSGQQIYARGGDLILLSSVSEGAEVLADGNIHVYGILRGRALAGVQGDETARIFCSKFHASLVSVAGVYLLNENFDKKIIGKNILVSLKNEQLEFDEL